MPDETPEQQAEELRKKLISSFPSLKEASVTDHYRNISAEGTKKSVAFLRKTNRRNDVAFLENFINTVNSDETLDSYGRLKLLKEAIAYMHAAIKKDIISPTTVTVGMDAFQTMLIRFERDLKEFEKMLKPNNDRMLFLFEKEKLATHPISLQNYVKTNQKTLGPRNKWTKMILKEIGKKQAKENEKTKKQTSPPKWKPPSQGKGGSHVFG